MLWVAAGFGFASIIIAMILSGVFIDIDPDSNPAIVYGLISMLGVGLIEEAAKFFPLASFIYKKSYFNEFTDGIIYFAFCGLVFGVLENFLYSLGYGYETGIARILLTPFFHAAGTAFIGFFLIKAKLKNKGLLSVFTAYLGVAILHGFYNFGFISGIPHLVVLSLMISALLTMSIFLLNMKANELDKELGLSASGENKYCRQCGAINNNSLYCVNCGRKA